MARLPRIFYPGIAQHLIQRGNNKHICFTKDEDYAAYAHWLHKYSSQFGVAIHAWVFMTNHVHLLVTPSTSDCVPRMMQSLGREYVRYFNNNYERTGTLWEGRYKSCVVDADTYLLACYRYIELNPVRAGLVISPSDYIWSSYQTNALGHTIKLCTPHDLYIKLGDSSHDRLLAYQNLFDSSNKHEMAHRIRHATNKGIALGNDRFRAEIEQLTGRRASLLRRVTKPRS